MKFKALIKFLCLVALAHNCSAQNKLKEKRLDSLFNTLAAQNQFSGSVLIAENGNVLYKGAKGYRDEQSKQPNNVSTIFELASCSKQFVGVGIALLHREGKLNYTDDITAFIPELVNFKGVKIYNLLRHTSGVPEYLAQFREDWKSERIATNQDVIIYYARQKDTLEFEPGNRYDYCNTNYALLATIIERVSGKSLNDYLTEKIFKPLKMDRTFVYNRRLSPKQIDNYAYGYLWLNNSFEKATEDDSRMGRGRVTYYMDGIIGNAKVNATVEDIYKWINALKSNRLLTQQEFDEILENSQTSNSNYTHYGFGFEVRYKDNKLTSYGHTGSWDGYSTLIYHNVDKDRTIIVFNNFDKGICPFEYISDILDNKAFSKPLPQRVKLPEASVRQFAGEYVDSSDTSSKHLISYLDDHLVYNTSKLNWDMRFFPTSENTFQAIRQGGADGQLMFSRQNDGAVKLVMTQYGSTVGEGIRAVK